MALLKDTGEVPVPFAFSFYPLAKRSLERAEKKGGRNDDEALSVPG